MGQVLGIIGTGHFAGYLVAGLCRAGDGPRIVVSPRNATVAQRLAEAFGGMGAETFGVKSGGVNRFTLSVAAFWVVSAVLIHII